MREIRIKRGATLGLSFQFLIDGVPLDMTTATLSSQVRTPDDTLVANLTLVKQSPIGLVTAQVPDTSQWPLGRLRGDVKVVSAGLASFTETFALVVTREVTQS